MYRHPRFVLKAYEQDHVLVFLETLHWLPIKACIECKETLQSLMQPLFICLTFFVMCTLHQDSSAPLLTHQLYAYHTRRLIFLYVFFCLKFSAS